MYIFWKHCPHWANTTKDMNYHHINHMEKSQIYMQMYIVLPIQYIAILPNPILGSFHFCPDH